MTVTMICTIIDMKKPTRPVRTGFRIPAKRRNGNAENEVRLLYANLESRCVLASLFSWDASTLSVTIFGDSSNNWATVDTVPNNRIRFSADSAQALELDLASVARIFYLGYAGNDSFTNNTAIETDARGHSGNDSFLGGSGRDVFYGGDGDDLLDGQAGDDFIYGGDGIDQIVGGSGNDWLSGDYGNDLIYGGDGDDTLAGGWGDDQMWGQAGADYLLGFTGNDWLYGGDGMDYVYGQAGDDHVYGGAEFDRVRGNNGHDQVFGEDGDDWIMGDDGDDLLDGGNGNDTIWAWAGNDTLVGGAGDDGLYGQDGNDTLNGGDGADVLSGGNENDQLFGGTGNDYLDGNAGQDILRGDDGADVLRGGDGMDSLFGGSLAGADTLYGDGDADRFLTQTGDVIADRQTIDAELQFLNYTSDWNDAEISIMDTGFALMQAATNNTRLLKDTLTTAPLQFFKYDSLGNAAGVNWLQTTTTSTWQNDQWVYTYSYRREIRIAEWDETNTWRNLFQTDVVTHEIGHNWDSQLEMSAASSSLGSLWQSFQNISDWRNTNPQSGQYSLSGNGQWWYLTSSPFYDPYGQTNPNEDFSTTWELFFDPNASAGNRSLMANKLAVLDQLMAVVQTL